MKVYTDDQVFAKIKRFVATHPLRKEKVTNNRVLIIKNDGIGDMILFFDAAKELKKLYKDKDLSLICPPNVAVIAENSGYFDHVYTFEKGLFNIKKWKKCREIAEQFDAEVLIAPSISRDVATELLNLFIVANRRISVNYTCIFGAKYREYFLSQYDEVVDIPFNEHCLKQNQRLVYYLGGEKYQTNYPILPKVNSCKFPLPKKYYVVFLGGSTTAKKLEEEKYLEVVKYLKDKTDAVPLLMGGWYDRIQEDVFRNANIKYYSLIAKTDIYELEYVIANAIFVIGNDTSAIHMAISYNVPVLAISSAVSGQRFYPYYIESEDKRIVRVIKKEIDCSCCSFQYDTFVKCIGIENVGVKKKKCLSLITAEDIIEEANLLLKEIQEEK